MKTTILFLLLFGTFYSCNKTNRKIHEVRMSDTLEASYFKGIYEFDYTLDVFNNWNNVLKFKLYNSYGSSGAYSFIKIKGTGDLKVAYEVKQDTSWYFAFGDTTWLYKTFNEAAYYLPNSGIPGPLNFTVDYTNITDYFNWGTSGPPIQSDEYQSDIINKGHVYLLAKNSKDIYIRIEAEVLGSSRMIIHGYGYSDDLSELFEE